MPKMPHASCGRSSGTTRLIHRPQAPLAADDPWRFRFTVCPSSLQFCVRFDEAMALLESDEDNEDTLLPEETGADFVESEAEYDEYDEFDGYEDEPLDEE